MRAVLEIQLPRTISQDLFLGESLWNPETVSLTADFMHTSVRVIFYHVYLSLVQVSCGPCILLERLLTNVAAVVGLV